MAAGPGLRHRERGKSCNENPCRTLLRLPQFDAPHLSRRRTGGSSPWLLAANARAGKHLRIACDLSGIGTAEGKLSSTPPETGGNFEVQGALRADQTLTSNGIVNSGFDHYRFTHDETRSILSRSNTQVDH